MVQERRNWTRDELIIAFYQYCVTPFGKIHNRNPKIISLAEQLGRTTNALAMKMCNFASFDPVHQERNVKGLSNTSRGDQLIWDEFNADWDGLIAAYYDEIEKRELSGSLNEEIAREYQAGSVPTQTERIKHAKVRLAQDFFRQSVLSSYDYRCTVCQLQHKDLLVAGHIVPWSVDEGRRTDPRNGLAMCALHDRAFDRGLITVDEHCRMVLSSDLKESEDEPELHQVAFIKREGKKIEMPKRFAPANDALEYHRINIFKG